MKIHYVTAGDRTFASSRLRAFKPGEALAKMGHTIAFNPPDPLDAEVLVVQKRAGCEGLMREARARGMRVVLDVDDFIPSMPFAEADVVTVDTAYKREHLWQNAVVVPDALDTEADSPRKDDHAIDLKRAVTVCNAENLYHLQHAAEACRRHGIELTVITHLNGTNYGETYGVYGVQWSLCTVDAELIEHDLFIAPFVFDGAWSPEWVKSKSANRLYKAWALGLPVAGTPIASYMEAGLRYSATNVADWVHVLTALRSQEAREADAQAGYERAQAFRAERVAEIWERAFLGASNVL